MPEAASAGPFNFEALNETQAAATSGPPEDERSWFARAVDTVFTAPEFVRNAVRRMEEDKLRLSVHGDPLAKPAAMMAGFVAGTTEALATPGDILLTLSGLKAAREGARVANLARTVERAGSAALAARGAERVVDAETPGEQSLGVIQGALGLAGARGAHKPAPPSPRPVRGALPPAPMVVTPDGTVLRPGEVPPPSPAPPDPSYVRAVRGEWARREPRGALPPGPDFVVGEGGAVGRIDQAAEVAKQAGRGATPAASQSKVAAVPARVVGREFDGSKVTRKVYTSDPSVTVDAPKVQMTARERVEVQRIAEELKAIPFTQHTFNEIPVGRGGSLEVTGGAAGAPVYQDIVALGGSGSRQDVQNAIERFLAGT